eukprot:1874650-Rhodomonas_salina.1
MLQLYQQQRWAAHFDQLTETRRAPDPMLSSYMVRDGRYPASEVNHASIQLEQHPPLDVNRYTALSSKPYEPRSSEDNPGDFYVHQRAWRCQHYEYVPAPEGAGMTDEDGAKLWRQLQRAYRSAPRSDNPSSATDPAVPVIFGEDDAGGHPVASGDVDEGEMSVDKGDFRTAGNVWQEKEQGARPQLAAAKREEAERKKESVGARSGKEEVVKAGAEKEEEQHTTLKEEKKEKEKKEKKKVHLTDEVGCHYCVLMCLLPAGVWSGDVTLCLSFALHLSRSFWLCLSLRSLFPSSSSSSLLSPSLSSSSSSSLSLARSLARSLLAFSPQEKLWQWERLHHVDDKAAWHDETKHPTKAEAERAAREQRRAREEEEHEATRKAQKELERKEEEEEKELRAQGRRAEQALHNVQQRLQSVETKQDKVRTSLSLSLSLSLSFLLFFAGSRYNSHAARHNSEASVLLAVLACLRFTFPL